MSHCQKEPQPLAEKQQPAEQEEHNIIMARWTGRRKAGTKGKRAVDSFDVLICPRIPLQVGSFVHVLGIAPTMYWDLEYANRPWCYDVYDPQIFGPIIAIKAEYESTIELVVHNLNSYTTVDLAYISVEKIPGMTIEMDETGAKRRWKNTESSGPERPVKIDWRAVLTDPDALTVACHHPLDSEGDTSRESEDGDGGRADEMTSECGYQSEDSGGGEHR